MSLSDEEPQLPGVEVRLQDDVMAKADQAAINNVLNAQAEVMRSNIRTIDRQQSLEEARTSNAHTQRMREMEIVEQSRRSAMGVGVLALLVTFLSGLAILGFAYVTGQHDVVKYAMAGGFGYFGGVGTGYGWRRRDDK